MYQILRYTDEADKSNGIAGAVIALYACDGEQCIARISLEDGENALDFAPEAFYVCNPRFSAKIAWTQLMRDFQFFSGLFFGNVICRHRLSNRSLSQEAMEALREIVYSQGRDRCELDDDELEAWFNKDLLYYQRLFNHPTVLDAAQTLARNLRAQRRMTAGDVLEYLSRLSM